MIKDDSRKNSGDDGFRDWYGQAPLILGCASIAQQDRPSVAVIYDSSARPIPPRKIGFE